MLLALSSIFASFKIVPGLATPHFITKEAKMVDRYTKIVLSIIAVALSVIALKDVIPPAKAQPYGPTHVIVDSVGTYAYQYAVVPVRVQQ